MIKLIAKVTRPNTKMVFYPRPENVTTIVEQAKQLGKLVSEDSIMSKDKLTFTYIAVWNSQEDLIEYNQMLPVKEYYKRRRWFEQEFEHTRIVSLNEIEDINLNLSVQ